MKFQRSIFIALIAAIVAVAGIAPAYAAGQITSNSQTVTVSYAVTESITIAAAGGPAVIPVGLNSNVITVTGTYNLIPANHIAGIRLAVFPAGGIATALTGTTNIPSSQINVQENNVWAGACNSPDPDNVNGGLADQCAVEGTTGTSQLLLQAALNSAPSGTLRPTPLVFGFTGGVAPTQAGSWSGNFTILAYAP